MVAKHVIIKDDGLFLLCLSSHSLLPSRCKRSLRDFVLLFNDH